MIPSCPLFCAGSSFSEPVKYAKTDRGKAGYPPRCPQGSVLHPRPSVARFPGSKMYPGNFHGPEQKRKYQTSRLLRYIGLPWPPRRWLNPPVREQLPDRAYIPRGRRRCLPTSMVSRHPARCTWRYRRKSCKYSAVTPISASSSAEVPPRNPPPRHGFQLGRGACRIPAENPGACSCGRSNP